MRVSKYWLGVATVLLLTACGAGAGATDDAGVDPLADDTETTPTPAAAAPVAVAPKIDFDTAAARGERPLLREVYSYQGTSRDPFRALLTTDAGGPELPDMLLSTVLYNQEDPSRSIAIFREIGNNDRHTVRAGERIGRLYVASIDPGSATLTMNDFGTIRRQTYQLRRPGNQ